MELTAHFEDAVHIDSLPATTPEEAFSTVARRILGAEGPEAAELAQAFLERERRGTTAFGWGFAIPHAFHEGLARVRIAVARVPEGMDLAALDGEPTRVMICVAAPEQERETYMAVLRHVAGIARDRRWRRLMLRSPDAAGIASILGDFGVEA